MRVPFAREKRSSWCLLNWANLLSAPRLESVERVDPAGKVVPFGFRERGDGRGERNRGDVIAGFDRAFQTGANGGR